MAGRSGFYMVQDTLTPGIRGLPSWANELLHTTMEYYEPQVESYMKLNAPWKDQTTNARNGLIARAEKGRNVFGITLAHQVPYGIWLETRWAGKYAIIMPTIDEYGPRIMKTLNNALKRYKAG